MDTQRIGLVGSIKVVATNEITGEEIVLADWKNTVTYLMLTNIVTLLSQVPTDAAAAECAVHYVSFEASDTALPAADPSDSGPVGTEVATIVIDRTTGVTIDVGGVPGLVEYRVVLPKTDAIGSTIRAIGLYSRGDNDIPASSTSAQLLARQIMSPITKSADYKVSVAWRLQFTRV